jgi:hypothetical protein
MLTQGEDSLRATKTAVLMPGTIVEAMKKASGVEYKGAKT